MRDAVAAVKKSLFFLFTRLFRNVFQLLCTIYYDTVITMLMQALEILLVFSNWMIRHSDGCRFSRIYHVPMYIHFCQLFHFKSIKLTEGDFRWVEKAGERNGSCVVVETFVVIYPKLSAMAHAVAEESHTGFVTLPILKEDERTVYLMCELIHCVPYVTTDMLCPIKNVFLSFHCLHALPSTHTPNNIFCEKFYFHSM